MMSGSMRLAAACLAVVLAPSVQAQTPAEFYKGRMITIITWQGPGSSYDAYARIIGRHMGRHLPGEAQFRVSLMLGGGGIVAANHVAHVAPKDGSVLFMVGPGLLVEQALGLNKSLVADLRTFGWLGGLSSSNQVLVTWHTSPTQSLKDAMTRETMVGATGVGSVSYQLPAFYNNVLGTKFKIVAGYSEASLIEVAMERGELDGRATNPWATYKSVRPDWVAQKKITPIIQVGLRKERDLPHVPLMRDLAKTPADKEAIEFISKSIAIGRPVAVTPGVPADRLAALKAAFAGMVKDPEFVADVARQKLELEPSTAAEIEALVRDMINAPPEVRERVRRATSPPQKQ